MPTKKENKKRFDHSFLYKCSVCLYSKREFFEAMPLLIYLFIAFYAQEKRKFLTLPIQEKTAKLKNELVGEVEEEEEEGNEKKRTPEQIKSKIVLPKQTSGRHELKIAMMKGGK